MSGLLVDLFIAVGYKDISTVSRHEHLCSFTLLYSSREECWLVPWNK